MQISTPTLFSPVSSVPFDSNGREPVIDALRGYALFGVFLVRMVEYFSGWHAEPTAADPANQVLHAVVASFANHKFRALFSFLFGIGFYYQLQKQSVQGGHFAFTFLKRLAVLMGFGLLHAYFVWSGDILHWYAIAGLVLLVLHRLSTTSLLIAGLFLSIVIPNLYDVIHALTASTKVMSTGQAYLPANPSYWEMFRDNFVTTNRNSFGSWGAISFALSIGGYFLLGVWSGRVQLFRQLAGNDQLCKKLVIGGLVIGVASGGLVAGIPVCVEAAWLPRTGWVFLLILGFTQLNTTAIFIFHLSLIVFLFEQPASKLWLQNLIPAGKMTLTNYILQSIVAVCLFNGFGLGWWGKVSLPLVIAATVGLFGIQVVLSRWWLEHFQMGPLERLWRLLTKGKTPVGTVARISPKGAY